MGTAGASSVQSKYAKVVSAIRSSSYRADETALAKVVFSVKCWNLFRQLIGVMTSNALVRALDRETGSLCGAEQ